MITERELREIEIMMNASGISDSDLIGSLIGFIDSEDLLQKYLVMFPDIVKEIKRVRRFAL